MSRVVTICGSSRFVDVMAVCSWVLERDEGVLVFGLHLLPAWYPDCPAHHLAEHEGVSEKMDELHRRKIEMSDEVFLVDQDGYVGSSSKAEIAYAEVLGKLVRRFSNDPVGAVVRGLMPVKIEEGDLRDES